MTDLIKRALTRRIRHRQRSDRVIMIQPDDKLVLLVKFAIGMALCLTGLEIAHLVFLRVWSSEVFAAITGLVGTVTGVLVGHRT